MNIENFEKFKVYLKQTGDNTYCLTDKLDDIEHCDGFSKDFIISLCFSALNEDKTEINKLQEYLGDDAILYLYDNPGRNYGSIYIHNQNLDLDPIWDEFYDKYPNASRDDFDSYIEFYESLDFGVDRIRKEIPKQLKGSVYIDLSLPYAI